MQLLATILIVSLAVFYMIYRIIRARKQDGCSSCTSTHCSSCPFNSNKIE